MLGMVRTIVVTLKSEEWREAQHRHEFEMQCAGEAAEQAQAEAAQAEEEQAQTVGGTAANRNG